MFDFLNLKKSIEGISQRYRDLCNEVNIAKRESTAVQSARANRKDIIQTVSQWVDGSAAKFAPAVIAQFSTNFYDDGRLPPYGGGFLGLIGHEAGALPTHGVDVCMCAIFGDQIKQAIFAQIESMPWPNEGLPASERAAKLAELQSRISKLQTEVKTLRDSAEKAGIEL